VEGGAAGGQLPGAAHAHYFCIAVLSTPTENNAIEALYEKETGHEKYRLSSAVLCQSGMLGASKLAQLLLPSTPRCHGCNHLSKINVCKVTSMVTLLTESLSNNARLFFQLPKSHLL
jgi:hypothetical protein